MIFIQSTSVSWIYLANPPSQLIHPGNSPKFFIPGFSTQVINPGFQTQVLIPGFCNLGNKPGFHTQVLEPGLLTLVCKTQVSKPRCQLWIANIFNGMIVHMHRTKSYTIYMVRTKSQNAHKISFRFSWLLFRSVLWYKTALPVRGPFSSSPFCCWWKYPWRNRRGRTELQPDISQRVSKSVPQ